ncbi:MAG: UvrB/UvrC motif-containing protein [Planctomycetota bacterium]|jgi:hypothetical protein
MPDGQDIDQVLRDWPYEPGAISARLVQANDGREVLQMRIEMGLLQMETKDRPDGERPGGALTYLDRLVEDSVHGGDDFDLNDEEQCFEVDREFLQYYQRRICWLALREFKRAVADANHTLSLMDFVLEHSSSEDWTVSHEQYRPFVLFQRTQAAALATLDESGPEAAIEEVNTGLERIRETFEKVEAEEEFDENEMVAQLLELREWIRGHYDVGRTLAEQLADAVASEKYELAARLRDEIARRDPPRR